jgi:pyruvate kinase
MRLNFSHATYEEADMRIRRLRRCKGVHQRKELVFGGKPVGDMGSDGTTASNLRAVLLDTQGPEIRTGVLKDDTSGKHKIELGKGASLTLTTDEAHREQGDAAVVFVTYADLCSTVRVGSSVLLDDGAVSLEVTSIDASAGTVLCTVLNTGMLGSRKGVNLPGATVTLPPMTEKDRADLKYGVSRDVDFVAASFVRKAEDVHAIRDLLAEETSKLWQNTDEPDHLAPMIISKIENGEGMANFDEILAASDGIMVARGDLGVEIPMETVFIAQKEMIRKCREVGKPVIVATQMLESMIKNPRPTRAEVSDVANAVLDGCDCVMLSGECANGDYPVEAVQTMRKTLVQADTHLRVATGSRLMEGADMNMRKLMPANATQYEVLARSAVDASLNFKAPLIIVLSRTGETARLVAKHRPEVPVMAFITDPKVGRQLQIHRGIFPVCVTKDVEFWKAPKEAVASAKQLGWCKSGDHVVLVYALPDSGGLEEQVTLNVATVQ